MGSRKPTGGSAISGKDRVLVRQDLITNIIRLKSRLKSRFEELYSKSSMDHVRNILKELSRQEDDDIVTLEKAMEDETVSGLDIMPGADEDYERFDHLLQEEGPIDHNDVKSVLMLAMRYYRDLYNILQVMEKEYSDPVIKNAISVSMARELANKKKIEDLLDEIVHKDYW
ncbi:MAG: hypothetical protein M1468_03385 [Candidatus Thermoplasmatota archaeon]|jgi:hypothetical protein|nr:hypothetical protein [Candidatus Thermoplasmatota archaeon]